MMDRLCHPDKGSRWREILTFLEDGKYLDCEIRCGAGPASLWCHKLILASCSATLSTYLKSMGSVEDPITVILPDLAENEVRSFINQVYSRLGNEADGDNFFVCQEVASELGLNNFNRHPAIKIEPTDFLNFEMKSEEHQGQMDDNEDYEDEDDNYLNYVQNEDNYPLGYYDNLSSSSKNKKGKKRKGVKMEEDWESQPKKRKRNQKPRKKNLKEEENDLRELDNDEDKPKKQQKYEHCKECDTYISGKRPYLRHRRVVHKPEENIFLSCRECKKELNLRVFRYHVNYKHGAHTCEECGVTYANKNTLLGHKYNNHFKYTCEICGLEVVGKPRLQTHMDREHRDSMYSCDICGKTFDCIKNLRGHKYATHRKEEDMRYECEFEGCTKRFNKFIDMKSHLHTIHLKDNPFICRYECGARYNSHANLRWHEKHTHGKALPCVFKSQDYKGNFPKKK